MQWCIMSECLMAKEIIMSILKKLNATSEMLVKASGTIDKRIAAHLVDIAKHINGAGNGDVSAANYFFSLLTSTSGVRKDAIGNWLMAYAGCSWNAEKKQFGRKKGFTFSEQLAVENPWYKFTPAKEFKPFDLDKALAALIKKAHAALEDEEHADKHKVRKDRLVAIEALLSDKPAAYIVPKEEVETPVVSVPPAVSSDINSAMVH